MVGGNHKFGVKAEVDMDRDFFCGRVLAWRVWSAQRIAVVVFSVLSGVVVVFLWTLCQLDCTSCFGAWLDSSLQVFCLTHAVV